MVFPRLKVGPTSPVIVAAGKALASYASAPSPTPPTPPLPLPINGGAVGADAYGTANPAGGTPYKSALPGSRFEFMQSSNPREIVAWRLTIYTLDGGLNLQRGPVEETHARVAQSTA
ncbi:MAG: hypothetical protein ACREXY_04935, partial [Gammaproteobacteria bacterium]